MHVIMVLFLESFDVVNLPQMSIKKLHQLIKEIPQHHKELSKVLRPRCN